MSSLALWRAVPGSALLWVLNLFTAVALIFEGYNQGVMGGISGTPDFIRVMGIGADGVVTNSTKQGGLVAAYYGGAMFGCFAGGKIGDMLGRKKGVWIASCFCILGAALMAGSTNSSMFIVARIIAGKVSHTELRISSLTSSVQAWVLARPMQSSHHGSRNSHKHTTAGRPFLLSSLPTLPVSSSQAG